MCNKIFFAFFAYLVTGSKANEDGLVALGTVEGKSYFVHGAKEANLTDFAWTAAKFYCEKHRMKLASIETEAQAEFLKLAYDPVDFNGWYWVAAKYNEEGGWSWAETGEKVQSYSKVLLWQRLPTGTNTSGYCLCYSSNSHDAGFYFMRACHHLHYVLCETWKPLEAFSRLSKQSSKQQKEIIEIGTLNGTTYYADKVLRNWTESRSFCLKNGMQLATIREQARENFLKNACVKHNFDGYIWVLGNDGAIMEPSHNLCPYYIPHESIFNYKICVNKYFSLCERANTSSNKNYTKVSRWDSDANFEGEEFREVAVCKIYGGSFPTVVVIISILVVGIGGLLIWKIGLRTRIFRKTLNCSDKRFPNVNYVNGNMQQALS